MHLDQLSMATAAVEPSTNNQSCTTMNLVNPKPLKVCFSYAAYAKNLIHNIHSLNIPVEPGLSDAEFAAVESSLNFTFPPDLRAILQEGLPVGHGFLNWRSSSKQQLEILTNLPILGICKRVSRNELWIPSWGDRPDDTDRAIRLAGDLCRKAPILVPIYRHFYIPSTPCVAGNPVFYVHGGEVRLWSFDIAGFFHHLELRFGSEDIVVRRPWPKSSSNFFTAPAWAATEGRRIEFWTEMAETGKNTAARLVRRRWWSGDYMGGCLEEVCWRLRNGGWKEEDVREMMMMDGCDVLDREDNGSDEPHDHECVKALSKRLLSAGWSTEDVVESLGFTEDSHQKGGTGNLMKSCFDFPQS